jgi:hypothetical protein
MQVRYRSVEGFAPWVDDDGPLWAQPIEVKADRFSDPPFDTVTHHGFAQGAGTGEADVRSIGIGFLDAECRKERAGESGTLVVNSAEILGTQEANTFRKTRYGDYPSLLTVNFLRPRARRRAKTARPFLVSMRERNPCVLARWRLFG